MGQVNRTVLIGITGLAGSGKSTVAGILKRLGAVVIDADEVAREVLEKPMALEELREQLGEQRWQQIVQEDGSVDRKRLRTLILHDKEAKRILESITHPQIAERIASAIRSAIENNAPAVVVEAALLIGSGFEKFFDAIIFVDAPLDVCAARVAQRDGVSVEQAKRLLEVQPSPHMLRQSSSYVVENSEDWGKLEKSVETLWTKLINYNK